MYTARVIKYYFLLKNKLKNIFQGSLGILMVPLGTLR
jgi:hypothetical protein